MDERLSHIDEQLGELRRDIAAKEGKDRPVYDDGFLPLAQEVKRQKRTMLTRERLWIIWQSARNVTQVEGAAAEVGSFRGGSAYFIAAALKSAVGKEVPLEVIDTFAGHPATKLSQVDTPMHRETTTFEDTTYEGVTAFLSEFDRLTVHNGEFSQVAPDLPDQRYRLVHVDVDLYESARDSLSYFEPRMSAGGIIVLDDYGSLSCPGIQRAAREFLEQTDRFQSWNPLTKQLVLVRRSTE